MQPYLVTAEFLPFTPVQNGSRVPLASYLIGNGTFLGDMAAGI